MATLASAMIDYIFIYDTKQPKPVVELHGITNIDIAISESYTVSFTAREALLTNNPSRDAIHIALAISSDTAIVLDILKFEITVSSNESMTVFLSKPSFLDMMPKTLIEAELDLTDESIAKLTNRQNWSYFDYDLFTMLVDRIDMPHRDAINASFIGD